MSPNPYPTFKVSPKDKPEQIEKRIGMLIRLYVKNNDPFIAEAITEHINALLSIPHYISSLKQRCILSHLAAHWQCLAWIQRESTVQQ